MLENLLVRQRVSLFQVQELLGHSSRRVTEIYAHLHSLDIHPPVELLSFRRLSSDVQQQREPDPAYSYSYRILTHTVTELLRSNDTPEFGCFLFLRALSFQVGAPPH